MLTAQNSLGHQELQEQLLVSGANAAYATEAWVRNHYRWVVWKLARLELLHGAEMRGRLLTAGVVLDELKARWVDVIIGVFCFCCLKDVNI